MIKNKTYFICVKLLNGGNTDVSSTSEDQK